jgi:hypothetical protein
MTPINVCFAGRDCQKKASLGASLTLFVRIVELMQADHHAYTKHIIEQLRCLCNTNRWVQLRSYYSTGRGDRSHRHTLRPIFQAVTRSGSLPRCSRADTPIQALYNPSFGSQTRKNRVFRNRVLPDPHPASIVNGIRQRARSRSDSGLRKAFGPKEPAGLQTVN